jgi:hypothetical protein
MSYDFYLFSLICLLGSGGLSLLALDAAIREHYTFEAVLGALLTILVVACLVFL